MKNICFLVSGNGGTLKFMYYAIQQLKEAQSSFKITNVISDRDCGALNFAKENNIPNRKIKYSRQSPDELKTFLDEINFDFIITNIHKIIDQETVLLYEGKLVNLHYSILPAYSGLIGMETIDRGLQNNNKIFGATCHLVDIEVDNGQILSQCAVPLEEKSTIDKLKNLVFRGANLILLNSLLRLIEFEGISKSNYMQLPDGKLIFSPALQYNPQDLIAEDFWSKLN